MKVFISYSHRDLDALNRLHVHLAMLRRDGLIHEWFDREILAGSIIDNEVELNLEQSQLVLLLVSPDFLSSDYCYNIEMKRALERHRTGDSRVVPIIIEPCEWMVSPLRDLKALPRDAKPVSEWTNANNAYLDIAQELRRVVENDFSSHGSTQKSVIAAQDDLALVKRYRIKRDFDEIDRSEFMEAAFVSIQTYFERAVDEIDRIEGLRARFTKFSRLSFGCTIVNRNSRRSSAHLTVHRGKAKGTMGDIFYSFTENAEPNTANGGFQIVDDGYNLFLSENSFGFDNNGQHLTTDGAAERLWTKFLDQAGVSYD